MNAKRQDVQERNHEMNDISQQLKSIYLEQKEERSARYSMNKNKIIYHRVKQIEIK